MELKIKIINCYSIYYFLTVVKADSECGFKQDWKAFLSFSKVAQVLHRQLDDGQMMAREQPDKFLWLTV